MDAIRQVLEAICGAANTYLNNIDQRADPWVALTSLVDHDGTLNPAVKDKIVMCVYNVTREITISTYQSAVPSGSAPSGSGPASLVVVTPPLYIDIYLMFMANFSEKTYSDGLAALSRVISFFQQTPYFNLDNAPGMGPDVDRVTLDFENLSPVDVNYVMGMLGTRYFPSAFYKLRMIPFVATAMQSRTYAVTSPGTAQQGASS